MAVTQEQGHVSLKLVVNKETNKVLFAEAGKDFVDVLFSFLTLPLGTIVRLLEKESNIGPVTIGCLNSLYHSVTDLDNCLWNRTFKEILLQPRNSSQDYCNSLKLNIDDSDSKYYVCTDFGSCSCFQLIPYTTTLNCRYGFPLTRTAFSENFCNGFVNAAASFIVTDDLIVMPNSVDYTTFALLQNLGIKSPSSVKEMTVNVNKEKVLDLLKCSLLSKTSLTNLFLEKKPIPERSRFLSFSSEEYSCIKIMLKLVIRKSDGKILYAQGEKDFADLVLSFLTFPLGGVVSKLGGNCSLGSIDGLYKSIADLNDNKYLMSKEAKNRLLDPHLLPQFKLSNKILSMDVLRYSYRYVYANGERILYVQFFKGEYENKSNLKCYEVFPTVDFEGFVKGPAMYVVTDDLVVAPLSPISALNLLNRLNTPFNDLKEKVVTIGLKECLNILKASLTSTSALTNGLGRLLTEVKEEK
ncbi:uncharacterized protein LOC109803700 [Cajanus cajan]|uniref:uncharacterized protein LOC109803700 n=1 Tax=Cajanus cajan TaxID=3821 RepID=UPI00098DD4A2|nr:uncharacterized protein LOC109803700 [Cajanus cajan]